MKKTPLNQDHLKPIMAKWQKNMTRLVFIIILIVLLMELIFMAALFHFHLTPHTVPQYVMKFIMRPLLFNLIVFGSWQAVLKWNDHFSLQAFATIMAVSLVLSCIIVVHSIFPAVYAALLIPMFISLIYQSKQVTRQVYYMENFIYLVDMVLIGFKVVNDAVPDDFIFNAATAWCTLPLTYLLVRNMVDFEESRLAEELLEHEDNLRMKKAIKHDKLTQIMNYAGLNDVMKEILAQHQDDEPLHMAVIDLDHFKRINDTYGHNEGNVVLRRLGGILSENSSENIMPARYGGEEFAIIFKGLTLDEAFKKLQFIHDRFGSSTYEAIPEQITFSAGIASYEKGMNSVEFFQKADHAMYEAKHSGRNKIVVTE